MVRDLVEADRGWVADLIAGHVGVPRVVSRGTLHDVRALDGLIAELAGERAGVLLYRDDAGQGEVVVLVATVQRQGVGRALLSRAASRARTKGWNRLWLVTSNDNTPAISFYTACGWRLSAIHRDAITEARRTLKPQIPMIGRGGVPVRDEIEFELDIPRD